MAYRLTNRAAAARQRRYRPDIDPSEQRTSVRLPDRRRVLIIIDTYRAVVDGKPWRARIGWSRVLDRLRVAMPRVRADFLCR